MKVIVEPGNKHGFKLLNEAREFLIAVYLLISVLKKYIILSINIIMASFIFKYACDETSEVVEAKDRGHIFAPVRL